MSHNREALLLYHLPTNIIAFAVNFDVIWWNILIMYNIMYTVCIECRIGGAI